MSPAIRRLPLPVTFLCVAWLALAVVAQPPGNSSQIETNFKAAKVALQEAINTGKKPPADVIDAIAKYYVYRVAWVAVLDSKSPSGEQELALSHVQQFNKDMSNLAKNMSKKDADAAFAKAFAPVIVARFKELTDMPVAENGRSLAYGMQMLPALAKLQNEEISKYLLELLDSKNGKHDMIKLGALKALREFMPVDGWGDQTDSSLLANKEKTDRKKADLERVESLTQFILRPPVGITKPDEMAAFHFVRREAIETLAMAKAPAVSAVVIGKDVKKVEGPIAPVLLRVLLSGPEGITPAATLAEKNAAALGLCNMPYVEKYEPGPTYYFINKTLFEMVHYYTEEFSNNTDLPTKFPWKVTARSWEDGLKKLKESAAKAGQAEKRTADEIERRALPLLKVMETRKKNIINASSIEPDEKTAPSAEFLLFKKTIPSTPMKWERGK